MTNKELTLLAVIEGITLAGLVALIWFSYRSGVNKSSASSEKKEASKAEEDKRVLSDISNALASSPVTDDELISRLEQGKG